jgi:hypothetical protein
MPTREGGRYFYPEERRYRGTEYELDLFGAVRKDKTYHKNLSGILSREAIGVCEAIRSGYQLKKDEQHYLKEAMREINKKREELIGLIKESQKGDPTNPEKDFLRELRLSIIENLGFSSQEDQDRVKAYSSVDTPLDIAGVDGFITVSRNGGEVMVTLDAKLKKAGGKADIVFYQLPDVDEDEDAYLIEIEKLGLEASNIIKDRLEGIDARGLTGGKKRPEAIRQWGS